jgi:hypothetical protein
MLTGRPYRRASRRNRRCVIHQWERGGPAKYPIRPPAHRRRIQRAASPQARGARQDRPGSKHLLAYDSAVIARTWHGWTASPADADAYDAHFRSAVLTAARRVLSRFDQHVVPYQLLITTGATPSDRWGDPSEADPF